MFFAERIQSLLRCIHHVSRQVGGEGCILLVCMLDVPRSTVKLMAIYVFDCKWVASSVSRNVEKL